MAFAAPFAASSSPLRSATITGASITSIIPRNDSTVSAVGNRPSAAADATTLPLILSSTSRAEWQKFSHQLRLILPSGHRTVNGKSVPFAQLRKLSGHCRVTLSPTAAPEQVLV